MPLLPRRSDVGPESLPRRAAPHLASAALRAAWWIGVATLLALTAIALARKITWYLSIDQFGYATFARDLLAGRVFHVWPPADALAPLLPEPTDVLAQTYVRDHGRLYCRYAPGFPLLLAAWIAIVGADGMHHLNPTLFLLTVALLLALERRLSRSRWRALVAGALLVLLPTQIHLWGLTLTRDLSAHLVAFTALFLLLPAGGRPLSTARTIVIGLLLGFSVSIRPDELLYLTPAAVLGLARWRRGSSRPEVIMATALMGLAIGVAPLLAYDWLATGNPLRPTQSMETRAFLAVDGPPTPSPSGAPEERVGFPSGGWRGGTIMQVQGGGLRLANLRRTLPSTLALLRDGYGWLFVVAAVWGTAIAFVVRPAVAVAALAYVGSALLLYGCWSHPDSRYLIGIHLFLVLLLVEGLFGTFDLVRRAGDRRRSVARALAAGAGMAWLAGAALAHAPQPGSALPTLRWLVPAIVGGGALLAAATPGRRVVALVGPALTAALIAVIAWRAIMLPGYSSFQRAQVVRARATLAEALEPGAVVITTEDLGRPAENIEYYSTIAHALYLTDLERWRIPAVRASELLLRARMRPYLLVSAEQPEKATLLGQLRTALRVDLVREIPAARAVEYFVHGFPIELYRIRERETGAGPAPG